MELVLEKPEVHDAMCNLISQGISTWVQGDGPEHLEEIIARKYHQKAAREIGKQLPSLVGSISKGVVESFNPFKSFNRTESKADYQSSDVNESEILHLKQRTVFHSDLIAQKSNQKLRSTKALIVGSHSHEELPVDVVNNKSTRFHNRKVEKQIFENSDPNIEAKSE
mmetsp:Transcript_2006/g.2576  ORF Transcript_2006/g.2576 Transcript_2006/m.2576 type:complete len:167 (-) Transcript_2006:594-1094(-)